MIVNSCDLLRAYNIDPKALGKDNFPAHEGAIVGKWDRLYDGRIPEGLVCGENFFVRRNFVKLFDKRWNYPFEFAEFQAEVERLLGEKS